MSTSLQKELGTQPLASEPLEPALLLGRAGPRRLGSERTRPLPLGAVDLSSASQFAERGEPQGARPAGPASRALGQTPPPPGCGSGQRPAPWEMTQTAGRWAEAADGALAGSGPELAVAWGTFQSYGKLGGRRAGSRRSPRV